MWKSAGTNLISQQSVASEIWFNIRSKFLQARTAYQALKNELFCKDHKTNVPRSFEHDTVTQQVFFASPCIFRHVATVHAVKLCAAPRCVLRCEKM